MLIFEWKVEKQSKSWCFSAIRWELIKILKFEFNTAGSIKMLKFERKRGDWSNVDILLQIIGIWLKNKELIRILKLRTKLDLKQYVEIWELITKSFEMLYFEWKVGNQSKSWHLSAIRCELIKMLKFECKMSSRSNWVKRGDWSKCLNLNEKAMIN